MSGNYFIDDYTLFSIALPQHNMGGQDLKPMDFTIAVYTLGYIDMPTGLH